MPPAGTFDRRESAAPVVIVEREYAKLARRAFGGKRFCICAVPEINVELAVAAQLKNAFGRATTDKGQVSVLCVAHILHCVVAAPDVREAKVSDQTMRHVVAFDGGERRIRRSRFRTVGKLETPDAQGARLVAKKIFDAHESLFEDGAPVLSAVGGTVVCAETKLTARRGRNCVFGKVGEPRKLPFDLPVESLFLLAETKPQRGCAERVFILEARRFKPSMIFRAQTQAARKSHASDLDRL